MALNLPDIALALSLVAGGHSLGHVNAGDDKGYEVSINPGTFSEQVHPKIRKDGKDFIRIMPDDSDRSYIEAGGFFGQDKLSDALGKNTQLANAVYKMSYLAGLPKKINGNPDDFDKMETYKGKTAKNVMKGAVAISAISDMLKAFGKGLPDNQDLSFWTSDTGAPGLMYSRRF